MAILHGWKVCPRCAEQLDLGEIPASVSCGACGFVSYANPKPTVSALVVDGEGRLLLARRAVEPFRGFWDTPGGFVEEGEHPRDALRRELFEETGLVVEPGAFPRRLDGHLRRRPGRPVDPQPVLGGARAFRCHEGRRRRR